MLSRKLLVGILGGFALLVSAAARADIVYTLECTLSSAGCTPSTSYGTVTLHQVDSDTVSVAIDLTPSGSKVLELDMNFDPSLTETGWSGSGPTGTFTFDEDQLKADGYAGLFDIGYNCTGGGNLCVEPITIELTRTGLTLDDLNFTDTGGIFFVAVHIGSCQANTPNCDVGNSIWVGATDGGSPPREIPEPGIISLLAVALLGAGIGSRRRAKARG